MMNVVEKLALKGNCVLTPIYPLSNNERTENQLKLLKEEHFKKIELSDEIMVVNVNNYIGNSVKLETDYANKINKKIAFYTDYMNGEIK